MQQPEIKETEKEGTLQVLLGTVHESTSFKVEKNLEQRIKNSTPELKPR